MNSGVEGELAQAVADAVRVSLTAPEETALLRRVSIDPEAYDLFFRGRHFFNLRARTAVWKSLYLYQQAVDRDPTFAAHRGDRVECRVACSDLHRRWLPG